ncbi:2Fe-2S iron-sulfur cluster-binding protein [Telmatospirillum sp.]|uniref:2Fe-2S iron-sulfur cluster-binding protein n=1 Tax=Telmatospirillum sp. TaxID=2079197 RepID=UPI00284FECEC|nr:2Fe-2S iron-sulfur cluster-binding protein [Telmatospirillum sp.]MDR3440970.1 2Fe-2S iron-sulfur cluster-binding protein [Telmatospirillum sp.]
MSTFTRTTAVTAPLVTVTLNGTALDLPEGANLAAALLAAGAVPQALFCRIGICQLCALSIDGQGGRRACRTFVRAGLALETRP